jgi:chromosomal replication initiation ATPase DnaA
MVRAKYMTRDYLTIELKIKKAKEIISLINNYFNVNCNQLGRKSNIIIPRQMAMYYIRKNIEISYQEIGKLFKTNGNKGKNHATIIHACRTIENLIEFDSEIKTYNKYLSEHCKRISKLDEFDLDKYNLIKDINIILNDLDIDTLTKVEDYLNVY